MLYTHEQLEALEKIWGYWWYAFPDYENKIMHGFCYCTFNDAENHATNLKKQGKNCEIVRVKDDALLVKLSKEHL